MDFRKANFNKKQILEVLKLYQFPLDKIEISDTGGIANNNYRIKNNDFDIVLKVYSHGQSDKKKIEKEIEAISMFRSSDIKIPAFVKGSNDEVLQEYEGFNIVASEFIEGKVFNEIDFTDEKMFEVGKIVAKVETVAERIDVSNFECMNFREEFEYVSRNIETEIKNHNYNFDLTEYNRNLPFVYEVIDNLDNSFSKQFLHKDIWPWNLIDAKDGIYLLDFNDWAIGNSIIEISVALLEFTMFKSDQINVQVGKSILKGYKALKDISFTKEELRNSMLFICYLYFCYNVIQADDVFESEIYLKRIHTLLNENSIDLIL